MIVAFLIPAWFVIFCFLVEWDVSALCAEQVGGDAEPSTDVLTARNTTVPASIYDRETLRDIDGWRA